jgi:hypothetical protein
VTAADTHSFRQCGIVPGMVTSKRRSPPTKVPARRRPFFLRDWRKFMGTKAVELAIALDVERESYYRLEREWWTINAGEMEIIADTIGIKPSQLWFPPPVPGSEVVSLDDLIEEMDDPVKQQAAISAVRGIAGR